MDIITILTTAMKDVFGGKSQSTDIGNSIKTGGVGCTSNVYIENIYIASSESELPPS